MAGQFVATIGNTDQLKEAFHGLFFRGRREPRIAMVGRSNVGKSTLINSILGTKLAQTSAEPGKTRLLHFYLWVEAKMILSDLPGYGFAKASKEDRDRWAEFIQYYLKVDGGLMRALVLLDARHGPTEIDLQAVGFLRSSGIPISFAFTKFDTLKTQSLRAQRKKEAEAALLGMGFSRDDFYWVSAKEKDVGLSRLVRHLSGLTLSEGMR
jgi:GTP-binding protein